MKTEDKFNIEDKLNEIGKSSQDVYREACKRQSGVVMLVSWGSIIAISSILKDYLVAMNLFFKILFCITIACSGISIILEFKSILCLKKFASNNVLSAICAIDYNKESDNSPYKKELFRKGSKASNLASLNDKMVKKLSDISAKFFFCSFAFFTILLISLLFSHIEKDNAGSNKLPCPDLICIESPIPFE